MKAYLTLLSLLISFKAVEAHYLRDEWLIKNDMNPDYLHLLAMEAHSQAARIDAQHELGVYAADLFNLTKEFVMVEQFLYGFIAGFQTITSSSTCVAASKAAIF